MYFCLSLVRHFSIGTIIKEWNFHLMLLLLFLYWIPELLCYICNIYKIIIRKLIPMKFFVLLKVLANSINYTNCYYFQTSTLWVRISFLATMKNISKQNITLNIHVLNNRSDFLQEILAKIKGKVMFRSITLNNIEWLILKVPAVVEFLFITKELFSLQSISFSFREDFKEKGFQLIFEILERLRNL